jgi:hypothetical protein
MNLFFVRGFLPVLVLTLAACESTVPTSAQLDALEQTVRAEHQSEYAELASLRASGRISAEQHAESVESLDKKVRNKVDTMLWSRHNLAQSERKSLGIPTPDQPVQLDAPTAGQINGSLYSSSRVNGMGNQIQGNFMRDVGGSNYNTRRAGTLYDSY